MAKAKPIKQKKQNKFLQKLKFLLKTLFSNDACVSGREHKWYGPVIVVIVAALIATIPTMVGYFTTKASDFFTSGYSYDYENALVAFQKETSDVSMKIENGSLTLDETAWKGKCVNPNGKDVSYWGYYYKVPVSITEEKPKDENSSSSSSQAAGIITAKDQWRCGLAVYYCGDESPYKFASNKFSNVINDPNAELGQAPESYSTNTIVIGKDAIYLAKGVKGSQVVKNVQVKYDSKNFEGKDLHTILTPAENQTVIDAWCNFLENGYASTRVTLAWEYSGIMLAISVGIIFLMGLLIFIMTRGKNNPFRIYTFWQCQKIGYYASLCPALLGLLAFIPSFAGMTMFLFPMMYILRITWMSMRSLRPQA